VTSLTITPELNGHPPICWRSFPMLSTAVQPVPCRARLIPLIASSYPELLISLHFLFTLSYDIRGGFT